MRFTETLLVALRVSTSYVDPVANKTLKPVTTRVSLALHARLQARAAADERDVAYIVRKAIEAYLSASGQSEKEAG